LKETDDMAHDENIRLFAFCTGWGVPFETSAPFPLKLVTWLRMAGIPYEFVEANDSSKGPKGKAPWIEIGDLRMGDSSLIIEHLKERFGVDLDGHLDSRDRALAIVVQRMLEEHYHQCFEHQLFLATEGGTDRLRELATHVSAPISWILPTVVGRHFSKQLHARGMARHAEEVIIDQGKADLDALSELLGDRAYFLGDESSAIDACIFGFLGVSAYVSGNNPLFRHAASIDNLMRYCERMRLRYFPETTEILAPLFGAVEGEDDSGIVVRGNGPSKRAVVA
jgi:glutathione S-transferase